MIDHLHGMQPTGSRNGLEKPASAGFFSSAQNCVLSRLQMASLGGDFTPVVMPAIGISNWRSEQLRQVEIIQRGHLDRDVISAYFLNMAATERAYAAVLAEQVMATSGTELVVAQFTLAGQQSERTGFDDDTPVAGFGADRAVAFAGAKAQVDISFKSNPAAMAASTIGLEHHACF